MRRRTPFGPPGRAASLILLSALLSTPAPAQFGPSRTMVPGLRGPAAIVRDRSGVPHIYAKHERDAYLLLGYVHAQDRLFQIDALRRQASGTLAELLGPGALASDVEMRVLGVRRAAERSIKVLAKTSLDLLNAYAEGVNAYVGSHSLPSEYGALELTRFEPWTIVDSVAVEKLLAMSLSFDLDIDATVALQSYVAVGKANSFDGQKLFFEDVWRTAPFDSTASVPSSAGGVAGCAWTPPQHLSQCRDLGSRYLHRVRDLPLFKRILNRDQRDGSNIWVVSGKLTKDGHPLLANDPHLSMTAPSTWYPAHLVAGGIDVVGMTVPGIGAVIHGHNRFVAWGSTNFMMDVTDTYLEKVVPDAASPSKLSTVHNNVKEPLVPIPLVFKANNPTDKILDNVAVVPSGGKIPAVALIVPRRNNGPIIELDVSKGTALSVQYAGWSGTREVDAMFGFARARSVGDFENALQNWDVPAQNWMCIDVSGNIAYFSAGELPLREDLERGTVSGASPRMIRDGTGGNEWLPVQHKQPGQSLSYEILPIAEMPRSVNPKRGWLMNANNDPIGATADNDPFNQFRPSGGIKYLGLKYAAGLRAGRLQELLEARVRRRRVTADDLQEMQADVVMHDAAYFTPHILTAFRNAQAPGANAKLAALGADAGIAEAVGRLSRWDGSTPTGIPEGYDASDKDGKTSPPTASELEASIAATIYTIWKGRFMVNTIDKTLDQWKLSPPPGSLRLSALRNLLDNFANQKGVGASGVDFFAVTGVSDARTRRDIIILQSLADGLALLAGPSFTKAFGGSTNQHDYRWGKLHRVVLQHPLGGPFSTPSAGGKFPAPLQGLAGIPTDGGNGTVDAAPHDPEGDNADAFMWNHGPSHRTVASASWFWTGVRSSLPGGVSGVMGDRNNVNLLPAWLTNDSKEVRYAVWRVVSGAQSVTIFTP